MGQLTDRQAELLEDLVKAQKAVPEGKHLDFLTVSTFDGTSMILPQGDNRPLNRQDLDELIDQGFVRITATRKYGDINGHVTNKGFSMVEKPEVDNDQQQAPSALFEGPRDVPTVFISYSHESEEHKTWVRTALAERLMAAGIRVILDQWHLKFGSDLPLFMENAARADAVLLVCTPTFAKKANTREGGVGYETSIVTSELLERHPSVEPKFVPLWRSGERGEATPTYLKSAFAVNLRADNPEYEKEFVRLLRQLHREPEHSPPPLGEKPDFSSLD
ncbi:toll/interleukin-1 receptor domain-containing protein [Marinobacter sp. BGYM27]|uniref:toll/interleukin-1 receptor domain-containing protein n=1 Tax=Marinobacter sp. BGYM27 TaxID=2975597 RepID=UPI0021A54F5C|nr:toll/interleukin-1 receptor domain-containing protein [Marinobacter sp. BGYM27]MDG5501414.1 toll/interleukin-1 receptor domain-containing protein [Marinobacter sp. BGYM27]